MLGAIARRLFGSANDRTVKRMEKTVSDVNALEPEFEALDDAALQAKTAEFRARLEQGTQLDDLIPEAFATVREAAKRVLGQRHYDVQLMGGLVLHQGRIAEMATGEGKTLVSTLPVYLNALPAKGVHVVTVNDYLAKRDAAWMGQIYQFLGLTVGCIVHGLADADRKAAYGCDVTYGTNNELGFDYLRDNMKFRLEDMVQRDFHYAIVDEVDSILIDEARTPLIISGPTEDNSELYTRINALIPKLPETAVEIDEKARAITLTEEGNERMEQLLAEAGMLAEGGMYDIANISLVHHANQALKAHRLFARDKDYIVKDNKVVIIDEFTGRMMEGRRYSEGLHQALEAKEGVHIQNENQTLASITFQNYFRLYPKLAGMTGTAMTEAGEFAEIYGLEVVSIPTNRPIVRKDEHDEVYRTVGEKDAAILELIADCQKRGQPVLVGTVSIEKSETLSAMMKKAKIRHNVLNARYHEQEALIIAGAGEPGAVTIATNMAGRGTDIQLGGNLDMRLARELEGMEGAAREKKKAAIEADRADMARQAKEAGGLFVVGTERHESRRIDNQLRGRSGRQGDPGGSKFYLSLEDDLMRIFGSERMDNMLQKLGLDDGEAIVHPWINKALEKAQTKVEARNFEIRKNLLRFDDVMNDQRKVVYEQRREIMNAHDVADIVADMRHEMIQSIISRAIPPKAMAEQWDAELMHEEALRLFGLDLPVADWFAEEGVDDQVIAERLEDQVDRRMAAKAASAGPDVWRQVEKSILLQLVDQIWKEHLLQLDHLRQGIGLRAYGQRDPLNEYKREAFDLFEQMLVNLRDRTTQVLSHIQISAEPPPEQLQPKQDMSKATAEHQNPTPAYGGGSPEQAARGGTAPRHGTAAQMDPNDPTTWGKVSRNAPCPCGSGKKYKHCHGSA